MLCEITFSEFFFYGDFFNGTGGADFAAQCAFKLAVSEVEIQYGSPDAFDASFFESGRLEYVCWASVYALIAFDAFFQEVIFFD